MTGQHHTQIVSVTLALSGEQTGKINVQNAGTIDARLVLVWGSLMLSLTSPAQAAHVLDVWQRAADQARATMPLLANPRPAPWLEGDINTPGVVSTLQGLPSWNIETMTDSLDHGRLVSRHVAVRIGAITWNVHDQTAALSVCGLFTRANTIAPGAFTF